VGDLLSMQLGADQVLLTVKIKFPDDLPVEQIESVIETPQKASAATRFRVRTNFHRTLPSGQKDRRLHATTNRSGMNAPESATLWQLPKFLSALAKWPYNRNS
jgi:hypothetical protein